MEEPKVGKDEGGDTSVSRRGRGLGIRSPFKASEDEFQGLIELFKSTMVTLLCC